MYGKNDKLVDADATAPKPVENISWWAPQSFCRSRSSKDIDVGTNQKCVCDFMYVRNSNLGPILHHFGDWQLLCAADRTPIPP